MARKIEEMARGRIFRKIAKKKLLHHLKREGNRNFAAKDKAFAEAVEGFGNNVDLDKAEKQATSVETEPTAYFELCAKWLPGRAFRKRVYQPRIDSLI